MPFRVVALIAAFNEEDIIEPVIEQLVDNGIDVYLIDNGSTDRTVARAQQWLGRGLIKVEAYEPPVEEGSGPSFAWSAILRRKVNLTRQLRADWFIHHDADEIRESPWPSTLKEAIRWVDVLGYNCIDFKVLNFPPIDDGFQTGSDPRVYFTHYEDGASFDSLQVKCWKAGPRRVSLAASGGHDVRFRNRRLFPIQFVLRHYPIRSQEHGRRKVFAERKNRFLKRERSRGWHVQYDEISDESHNFLRDPSTLRRFELEQVRLELLRNAQ
jgi:glycosyltransferase involved in cell wall biosynthesis